ncbi:hypothetical protein [Salinicoccus sp. Marseille-QA3877]
MQRKLVVPSSFSEKFSTENLHTDTLKFWSKYEINNVDDLLEKSVRNLNKKYVHLNLKEIVYEEQVEIYNESSSHLCLIKDYNDIISGYLFIIPPQYDTRSGLLAQQVFPSLSTVISKTITSNENGISNRPVFIVNLNENKLTASKVINIQSGEYLGFNYIDVFDRDMKKIMVDNDLVTKAHNLSDYNYNLIKSGRQQHTNDFFDLDIENQKVVIKKDRISKETLTNQPYWFVIKGYTIVQMAVRENYSIDMEDLNYVQHNKTIDIFKEYVQQFIDEGY